MAPIDIVFIIAILIFAIAGFVNGFVNEIFGKAAPVVSAWIAILFHSKLVANLEIHVKIHLLAVAIAFLIVFVVVFILIKIIQTIFKQFFGGEILGSLDKNLGFLFGLVEGLAVVCVAIIVITSQPWFDLSKITEGSLFIKMLSGVLSAPAKAVSDAVNSAKAAVPPVTINVGK